MDVAVLIREAECESGWIEIEPLAAALVVNVDVGTTIAPPEGLPNRSTCTVYWAVPDRGC